MSCGLLPTGHLSHLPPIHLRNALLCNRFCSSDPSSSAGRGFHHFSSPINKNTFGCFVFIFIHSFNYYHRNQVSVQERTGKSSQLCEMMFRAAGLSPRKPWQRGSRQEPSEGLPRAARGVGGEHPRTPHWNPPGSGSGDGRS